MLTLILFKIPQTVSFEVATYLLVDCGTTQLPEPNEAFYLKGLLPDPLIWRFDSQDTRVTSEDAVPW